MTNEEQFVILWFSIIGGMIYLAAGATFVVYARKNTSAFKGCYPIEAVVLAVLCMVIWPLILVVLGAEKLGEWLQNGN